MAQAIAILDTDTLSGVVTFEQEHPRSQVYVSIGIDGLPPNTVHGLHIHQYGDMTDGCASLGGHYNPYDRMHGSKAMNGIYRHAGDLINNVASNARGEVHMAFHDDLITLYGMDSIIGRSVVLHSDPDDLVSQPSGNAGTRIACGVIGLMNPTYGQLQ